MRRINETELNSIVSSHSEPVQAHVDQLLMPTPVPSDDTSIDKMRELVSVLVARGFNTRQDIIESTSSSFADLPNRSLIRLAVEKLVGAELERHYRCQETWPEITDCDRLDHAFSELNGNGILARHDATCCDSCAGAEVCKEMSNLIDAGKKIRGYTFYHQQDTDQVAEDGQLFLSYGTASADDESPLVIAKEVCAVLRKYGLNTEWNGSISSRIQITLDWKKRRIES